MVSRWSVASAAAAAVLMADSVVTAAPTIGMIVPVAAGSGSPNYNTQYVTGLDAAYDVSKDFDATMGGYVTFNGTTPVTSVTPGSPSDLRVAGEAYNSFAQPIAWGYVDFGPNWANIRITGSWLEEAGWSGTDLQETMWWDSSITNVTTVSLGNGYGQSGNFPIPIQTSNTVNFNFRGVGNSTGTVAWVNQWSATSDGNGGYTNAITPAGEFLIIRCPCLGTSGGYGQSNTGDGDPGSNGDTNYFEYGFTGYTVTTPEPASLGVLGLGSAALLRRRRCL